MQREFDDELDRMDELEAEEERDLSEAVSINDPISSLNLSKPILLNVDDSLESMIQELQLKSMGCVLINRDSRLAGIITERDILLKITGKGIDLNNETLRNYMTENPDSLRLEDPIAFALNKMYVGGFRHVPITDDSDTAVGVISLVDIVSYISTFFSQEVLNLPPNPQGSFDRPEGG
jgi:CBS domain-containing protein